MNLSVTVSLNGDLFCYTININCGTAHIKCKHGVIKHVFYKVLY